MFLLAFLDDTNTVTSHERTATAFPTLQGALMIEMGIHLNPGKTKIWNAAGVKPAGCDVLSRSRKRSTQQPRCGEVQICRRANRG